MTTARPRAALAVAGTVGLIGTLLGAATSSSAVEESAASQAEATPLLSLEKTTDRVVAERWGRSVYVDLGVWLVAGEAPFEVRAVRPSYREGIDARLITPGGDVALPDDLMTNFRGLPRFTRTVIRNSDGKVVHDRYGRLCPGYEAVRVRPDAPDVNTYPSGCWYGHPYTLGAVYGITPGWGVPAVGSYSGLRLKLPNGRYDVRVRLTEHYRELLGLSTSEAFTDLRLRVVDSGDRTLTPELTADRTGDATPDSETPMKPAAERPTGPAVVPAAEYRPDLRSLPAYSIRLNRRGYLSFAATVWNAGPSPLVIDGFRRDNEDVMDAYQYFYDGDQQVGYEQVGEMEWHAAEQHNHWHFLDFARYRLLDEDKSGVVRSRKESFCLANTDAIDYTVPGANWHPEGTDLHTACGGYSALAVREVLDSGSGDTYYQSLPGQSFGVKNLPNGTYFIAVEANPVGNLSEVSTGNNIAYRKVILKGTGDNRRVVVPQVGVIEER